MRTLCTVHSVSILCLLCVQEDEVAALNERLRLVHGVAKEEAQKEALNIQAKLDAKSKELESLTKDFNERIAQLRAELRTEAKAKEQTLAQMESLNAVRLDEGAQAQARLSEAIAALNVARAAGKNGGYFFSAAAVDPPSKARRRRSSVGDVELGHRRGSRWDLNGIMSPGRGGSLSPTFFLSSQTSSPQSPLASREHGREAASDLAGCGSSAMHAATVVSPPPVSTSSTKAMGRCGVLRDEVLRDEVLAAGYMEDASMNTVQRALEPSGLLRAITPRPKPAEKAYAGASGVSQSRTSGRNARGGEGEEGSGAAQEDDSSSNDERKDTKLRLIELEPQQARSPPSPPGTSSATPKKGGPATKRSGSRKPLNAAAGASYSSPPASRRLMSDRSTPKRSR